MTPKAELHCHLEGAATPSLVRRFAERHGVNLDGVVDGERYVWSDFTSFLACYERACAVFRTAEDYRELTADVMARTAADGGIYGEVFVSPDLGAQVGLSYPELIEAVDAGMADAEAAHGIVGRIIVTCIRHFGPDRATAVARMCEAWPHPRVTGFGMAGDERAFAVADFASAFRTAEEAGLETTCHAGEFAGADSVRDALDHLGVRRIGHGIRAAEDPALMERLARERIVLEVCMGSNVSLGVVPGADAHPLRRLADAGVRVTLNSDDPPYFQTTLANEYALARDHAGFDATRLAACTRTAIEAAFVDRETRTALLARLS